MTPSGIARSAPHSSHPLLAGTCSFQQLVQREEQQGGTADSRPSWKGKIRSGAPFKKEGDNSTYEEMGAGGSEPASPVAGQPARPAKPAGTSFYEVDPWTQMGH